MWSIIGGSGFEHFEEFQTIECLDTSTPFGNCSEGLKRVKIYDQEVLFLPRHGVNHDLLPQEINYRANIFALKKWGASKVLSASAVGSLQRELKPGDLVIPTQYIDRTKSRRDYTFCGEGVVGHPSLADPVSHELVSCISALMHCLDFKVHLKKTYVCIEGPSFSTRAESAAYRQMKADIIGMTNFPEYALAREAGLAYLPCAFVTDYDCWDDTIPHVTLEEVMLIMKKNNEKAFQIVKHLLQRFPDVLPEGCPEKSLKTSLMTPWARIEEGKKEWLKVLMEPPQKVMV